jgi:hypothetical protein
VSYARKAADEKKKITRSPALRKAREIERTGFGGVAAVISTPTDW